MEYDAEAVAQIRPTKEEVEDELLAKDGVVGVDIGEKITDEGPTGELSILVFVEKKKAESRIKKADLIPKEIDGVKTDVQELEIELQHGADLPLAGLQVDPGTYDPLVGGVSMGPQRLNGAGTLGALVRDRSTGRVAALTNWHVGFADAAGAAGDVMVQPGRLDGGNTRFGTLTRGGVSEFVDASVVEIDQARAWTDTITGIGQIAGTAPATNGMAVQKRGRTTEQTQGTVVSVDATVNITFPGLGPRTLRRQLRIVTAAPHPRFSDRGDSGSVILTMDRRAVGLLFAGATDGSSTFANPIADVLAEMNVEFNPPVQQFPNSKPVICQEGPLLSKLICPSSPVNCPPLSQVVLCQSQPVICMVSKNVLCQVTSPNTCLVTRATCPTNLICNGPSTVICNGPGFPVPPLNTNYGYGAGGYGHDAGGSGYGGYGGGHGASGYGTGGGDFWLGYLAAMEQIAAELDAVDRGGSTESGAEQ